ncbi:MAG: FAD:protein FMN transferase [Acidimicrobiales bacterium]|nr:FAD:protein FMN transferase [Acidimicrobiales bacterium]
MKSVDKPFLVHEEPVMGTVAIFSIFEPNEMAETINDEDQLAHTLVGVEESGALPFEPGKVATAVEKACQLLHRYDEIFSTFKENSPLNQYRRGELSLDHAPIEIAEVLDVCKDLKVSTDGWFDPWAMPGGVDPTGIVKGWAEDRAISILAECGVKVATLNIGGDIAVLGRIGPLQKWRFGIRHPLYPDALIRIIETYENIATSANYERPGELIDPHLKMPVDRVASVSVLGPQLAVADAFATAAAVAGAQHLDWIKSQDEYSFYVLLYDGTEIAVGNVSFE